MGATQALGAVQRAFGGAEKGYDEMFGVMAQTPQFQKEFGPVVQKMSDTDQKLLNINTMLPVAKARVLSEPEAWTVKRKAILEGYRDQAAAKGLPWRESMEALRKRGMAVWEKEREECTDPTVQEPAYWEIGGKGTMHSYDDGNCCWEAAFDVAMGAFELVHMHHFPDVPPQECFHALHRKLDDCTIDALKGPARVAVDVGCGGGTSTFSLRETLNSRGLESCELTGFDLSTHFIAVARHRLKNGDRKGIAGKLNFNHGNALAVPKKDGEVDIFMASALTHEMPKQSCEQLFVEAARVLRVGGVFGYFDINPVQLMRNNPVSNLVDRVAISNEPFMHEWLAFDPQEAFRKNGFEVVAIRPTNEAIWPDWQNCPCRIIIARKLPTASDKLVADMLCRQVCSWTWEK